MARQAKNDMFFESNKVWQNRQDTERKTVEENLAALTEIVEDITDNTETWTFTVTADGTTSTVTKTLYIKPEPEAPEAE